MKNNIIKIGIDARMYGDAFTGIGRYTAELTKHFFTKKELNGRNIQWVLFMNNPEFSSFEFPQNVKKVLVDSPHYSLAEQTKFLGILNKENCDLVHFMHFNVPYFYQKPFTVTIHDTTLSFYPGTASALKQWIYKKIITRTIRQSKRVIAISENTKQDIQTLFKTPEQKISKVLNGLTKDFRPVSNSEKRQICDKFHLPDEFLFYSGVWKSHKNLKRLFYAVQTTQCPLVLTGTPDESLLKLAESLKIKHLLYMVGKVSFSDLVLLMGAAKIFVFPSLYEGFGLPPLEAMQAQTPVVCAKSSSLPEVCQEAVEYFDPTSHQDLAEKITQLWSDTQRQQMFVKKGLVRVGEFDWEKCAEQTWQILQSVLLSEYKKN